ncbi:uncharacterized protein LOC144574370 [Carex rostrata]
MEAPGIPRSQVERCLRSTDVRCFGTMERTTNGQHGEPCQRIERRLLEVYSIQFLDFTEVIIRSIFGTILLQTSTGPYTLAKRNIDRPQIIDQDGFFRLTGPERGIEANGDVTFVPFIYHLVLSEFHRQPQHDIWRADMEGNDSLYDQLMFNRLETIFGSLEINYAIYKDGAETRLDVSVIDWEGEEIEVYGTVGVRNSKVTHPKARSLLLDNNSKGAISVCRGKQTHLPLARQVTVLPLGSILIVDVCLLHCGTIIAQGTVRFVAKPTGDEELILVCNPGSIKVKATWLNQQAHNEAVTTDNK